MGASYSGPQVLRQMLVDVEGATTHLFATNLECTFDCYVPTVSQDNKLWSATIPARLLLELLGTLRRDDVIELVPDDANAHHVRIIADKMRKMKLNGENPDEFPARQVRSTNGVATLEAKTLLRALQRVLPMAAKDEARPVLTGVYFKFDTGVVTLVTADGYRLSKVQVCPEVPCNKPCSMLVPARSLAKIVKLLAKVKEGHVSILLENGEVFFDFGDAFREDGILDVMVSLILLEGAYVDYERVISGATINSAITVDRGDLVQAVKTAGIFARANSDPVFVVEAHDDELIVRAREGEGNGIGTSATFLDAELRGDESSWLLRSIYFRDALRATRGENVTIAGDGGMSPVRITSPDDQDALFLVMPIVVKDEPEEKTADDDGPVALSKEPAQAKEEDETRSTR